MATAKAAFAVGADGYLTRQLSYTHMMLMLELVAFGEKVVPKEFVIDFMSHAPPAPQARPASEKAGKDLSDRERSILRCLVDGAANKVIGRNLGITEATVKVHVKSILRKLNLTNRTQAAIWVVNNTLPDGLPEKLSTDS
jgi:two-component system nitrate/nitrite response regulator NarL